MSDIRVKLDIHDHVAVIRLNRPDKQNALTREMLAELRRIVATLAAQPDLRLVLLASSGEHFCTGMDLAQMRETADLPPAEAARTWLHDSEIYKDALAGLFTLPCPTLAVVAGNTFAGGLGLVLSCDLVLAATSARFWLPEPKRGLTAAIVMPLLVHRLGTGPASYLLFSGESIDAKQALHWGICHRLVTDDVLDENADALANSLLTGSRSALTEAKRQLLAKSSGILQQLEFAVADSARARETADAREGLSAYRERRPPAWQPPAPGQWLTARSTDSSPGAT